MKKLIFLLFFIPILTYSQVSFCGIKLGMSKTAFEQVISNDARFEQIKPSDYSESATNESIFLFTKDSTTEDYHTIRAIALDSSSAKGRKWSGIGRVFVVLKNEKVSNVLIDASFAFQISPESVEALDFEDALFWCEAAVKSPYFSSFFKGQEANMRAKLKNAIKKLGLRRYMSSLVSETFLIGNTAKNESLSIFVSNIQDRKETNVNLTIAYRTK